VEQIHLRSNAQGQYHKESQTYVLAVKHQDGKVESCEESDGEVDVAEGINQILIKHTVLACAALEDAAEDALLDVQELHLRDHGEQEDEHEECRLDLDEGMECY